MSSINLIVIIFLLILGGAFVAALGYYIINPILRLIKSSKSVAIQTKKRQSLSDFMDLIEGEHFSQALSILPLVPFLDSPSSTENFLFVRDHNQDFVTKCFFLFEKLGHSTSEIANLEMLFNERFELFSHLFKAQVNKKVLEEKHETNRKKLPSWAKEEFSNKENEINSALTRNLKDLESLLSNLSNIIIEETSDSLTIH